MLIYSGNPHSEGAKNLALSLGIKRIRHGGKFKGAPNKQVIIWGATQIPAEVNKCQLINPPQAIACVSNKLTFFDLVSEKESDYLPWYTTDKEKAIQEMRNTGCHIVCRTILNGSGGAGIVIAAEEGALVAARLYVKYVAKKHEYRIHVLKDKAGQFHIIDMQQKARKLDRQDVDWRVRNLENGFIYKRNDVAVPEKVQEAALSIMRKVEHLHFGGVDVIYNNKENKAYVLEVNSAPGLEGTTVKSYAEAFKEYYNV